MLDVDTINASITTLLTDYSTVLAYVIVAVLGVAAALLGLSFAWRFIRSKVK